MVVEREVVRAGGVGVNLAGAGTGRARVTRRHNRKGHICPKPRRTTGRRVGRERRGTRGVDVSGNDDARGRVQIRRAREDGATMRYARALSRSRGAPRRGERHARRLRDEHFGCEAPRDAATCPWEHALGNRRSLV